MANFAVLDGENVINTITADSKVIAEEITGKICIEYTTENAESGGTYTNGRFIPRKPYPSWVLNEYDSWQAPVPRPQEGGPFVWDESITNWFDTSLVNQVSE